MRRPSLGRAVCAVLVFAVALGSRSWALAPGCAWVSEEDALEAWDADGDGWPGDQDCDPADPLFHPYAYDRRGDGCDHDCGTEVDADGDDWPDAADCGPEDPMYFPCSPFELPGDGADYDCDGDDGPRADDCPGLDPDFDDVLDGDPAIPVCNAQPAEGA